MNHTKDYYSVLGVDSNSSINDIKKAYKKLANKYHPDRKETGDENKFKEINEAYQVLTKEKEKYDNLRNGGGFDGFGGFGGFGGFNDFDFHFNGEDIFNAFKNRYTQSYSQENLDIIYNLTINLEDVYNNREIKISYDRNEPCDACNATGQDEKSGVKEKCKYCNGGKDSFGFRCGVCGGSGKIYNKHCNTCKGNKVIKKQINFSLNNLYRINKSFVKYLKNYGHYSKQFPNKIGKLILEVKWDMDSDYTITNKGLLKNLNIHYEDAIKGNPILFDNLDGKKLKINLPKKTKDGDLIKIPKKGMLLDKTNRGDFLFKINIIIDYEREENEKTEE
jgi:molecular chaperone DnaJ